MKEQEASMLNKTITIITVMRVIVLFVYSYHIDCYLYNISVFVIPLKIMKIIISIKRSPNS